MVRDLLVAMFAMTAGFTLSGIAANIFRLATRRAGTTEPHLLVMIFAGPNVLLHGAAESMRARKCSRLLFWLASAVAAYWSLVLGLFLLDVAVTIKF
jgi:hypothetical protein